MPATNAAQHRDATSGKSVFQLKPECGSKKPEARTSESKPEAESAPPIALTPPPDNKSAEASTAERQN
jgi:hypothetical protein